GIETTFGVTPFREAILYDDSGREWRYQSSAPLFYMVRRGTGTGMLDIGLKQQAIDAGVTIRFNQRFPQTPNQPHVIATGPRGSFAIVVGYIFKTSLPDMVLGALSDRLAPRGYAYFVTSGGVGTIASCLFADLPHYQRYLANTVRFFEQRTGVTLETPRRFGGTGNVRVERSARAGEGLLVGEAAGFQDALWGFGLRYAMLSGHFAARALMNGNAAEYDPLWRNRFAGHIKTSFVNRFFYERLGDKGYRAFLARLGKSHDARDWLRSHYAPSTWKSLMYRLVRRHYRGARSESPRLPG
ncbi:MAG: hypothetical protein ABI613_11415, partial [Gemmatimonadota bacterium]